MPLRHGFFAVVRDFTTIKAVSDFSRRSRAFWELSFASIKENEDYAI
jgi:hypothetical protein